MSKLTICEQGVIEKLHTQAHAAFKAFCNGKWPPKRSQASPGDDSEVDNEYVLRFAGASGMVATAESEQHPTQERTVKAPFVQPPEGVHPTLFEYLKAFQDAGITAGLPPGSCVTSNLCNSDILKTCPFPPLQNSQPGPAVPDLAHFRPPIPPVWLTDESDSMSYTRGTSYTSPTSGASNSAGPALQPIDPNVGGREPLFELGPPQNMSPLNNIDDIRELYRMDMEALMRTMPFESPASMDARACLMNSQSEPSPSSTSNNPSMNDSPLDWENIFAMQAPSMDTNMPEQGWESFLTNGWS
jgi:hypothetical protein